MNVTYAAIMTAAVTCGFLVSRRTQRGLALTTLERLALGLGAFCGAMIGAKLPFVLLDWRELFSGAAWFTDGKTITFGLVGGYFGVEMMKWAIGLRIKTGDFFALPVALSVGIGRLGCFSAGCCHGIETSLPWGLDFGDGLSRHPTQLYESAFHLAMAGVLVLLARRNLFRGQRIKLYIITYFVYRFATEFLRPEPRVALGLTVYQWASLVFAPLFALLWWRDRQVFYAGAETPARRPVAPMAEHR